MNALTQQIIRRLREADGFVSGQQLSRELRISRATVSKHVQDLRALGYDIDSVPRRGYRLNRGINQATAAEVRPHLASSTLGRCIVFEEEIPSTNKRAMELADQSAPEGTVIVAECQSEGRGRMDRGWYSPKQKNLTFSMILRPRVPPVRVPELALVAAISLRETLQVEFPLVPFRIKWPNDLSIEGRKLSGILCEMSAKEGRVKHVVVGIGINVNSTQTDFPPELRKLATSIHEHTGRDASRPEILAHFLNRFEIDYTLWQRAEDLGPLVNLWHKHCLLTGRNLVVKQLAREIRGVGRGIDRHGRLVVEQKNGHTVHITSGDAHILEHSVI